RDRRAGARGGARGAHPRGRAGGRRAGPDPRRGPEPPGPLRGPGPPGRPARAPPRDGRGRRRRGGRGRPRRAGVPAGRPGDDQPRALVRHLPGVPHGRGVALPHVPALGRARGRHHRRVRSGAGGEPGAGAARDAVGPGGRILARHPHRLADAHDPGRPPPGRDGADLGDRRGRGPGRAADREAARRLRHRDQRHAGQARRGPGARRRRRGGSPAGGRGGRGPPPDRRPGGGHRGGHRGRGHLAELAPRAPARGTPGELRRHGGSGRRARPPPALLASVEPARVHHGEPARVSGDRAPGRARAPLAHGGPGGAAGPGGDPARAAGRRRAIRETRDRGVTVNQVWERLRAGAEQVGSVVPALLGAALILLVGYFLARQMQRWVDETLKRLDFNRVAAARGLDAVVERAGSRLDPIRALAKLIFWLVMLVVILLASSALGLEGVSQMLGTMLAFIPTLIAGIVIIILGMIVGEFVRGLIVASAGGVAGVPTLAKIAKGAVVLIAVFMALQQVGVAEEIVTSAFTLIVGAVALAVGLAFGLGNRELAGEITRRWYEQGQRRDRRRTDKPEPPAGQPILD